MTMMIKTTLNDRKYKIYQYVYSNFKYSKARPMLPLITNLQRGGIKISIFDIERGSIKEESVIIASKLMAIDLALISDQNFIASLKKKSFQQVKQKLCQKLECISV